MTCEPCPHEAFSPWRRKVKVTQSCLTLCDPMDCSLPGSSVHWILQARILQWVAIPFSRGSSWPRNWTQVSCIAGRYFTIWDSRRALGGGGTNKALWGLNDWVGRCGGMGTYSREVKLDQPPQGSKNQRMNCSQLGEWGEWGKWERAGVEVVRWVEGRMAEQVKAKSPGQEMRENTEV